MIGCARPSRHFQLRSVPNSGWEWLVGDGVVTLVLAVMIFSGWRANSIRALGTLVGSA